MDALLTLIDSTTALLKEAVRPLFTDTAEGEKQVAALQRKLAAYFRGLDKSFPMTRTAGIYLKHNKLREAASDIERELILVYNEWLEGEREALHNVLAESVEASMEDGFEGTLSEWIDKYKLKAPMDVGPLIPKAVVDAMALHIDEMVVGIDGATADELARVIADGLRDQRGIQGITKDIHDSFAEMSRSRAETIARTETNRAYSKGANAAAEAVGSQQKEWIQRSGYDDFCADNAAQGRIPFDEPFGSGHEFTPGHPRCTCDVAYYGATKTGVEKAIAT